ncbi:hypothetical protein [Actinomadura algeriensis]|uniref:Sodium:proton antiporter n=1 Tax=Actinomadura algeriensis TaxID=1679523 RepID=A0ABR9K0J5_9ACTN|nr:hypothetical protein [Actinomadura algeriensis]MBE1536348.1 hypothetical protein [Actinomadura algeriensis]
MTRGITAAAAEALAWWSVLLAGYLALVSAISPTEIAVGAAAAAAGAAAGIAARRVLSSGDAPRESHGAGPGAGGRPGWAARLPAALAWLPPQVAADTVRVLLRGGTGGRWIRLRTAPGPSGRGAAALLVSASPGGFAGAVDPGRRLLLVHRLGPGPSPFERRLARTGLIAEVPPGAENEGAGEGEGDASEGGSP